MKPDLQKFDCLSRDCPLFGPHLLEASAGTGKTFSIEHIYVRLILQSLKEENQIEVESILVVTFTRAATRELKARIRENFEKALAFLRANDSAAAWDYLKPFLAEERETAIRALEEALSGFDRCQIFTIHGFCWRMLREFAFEARIGFSLPDPDGGRQTSDRMKQGVQDFLEYGIEENLLCAEQAALLLKKYPSLEMIGELLLKGRGDEGGKGSFAQFHERCKAALQRWPGPPIEGEKLQEDFFALQKNFKAVKGDLPAQAAALGKMFADPENPIPFRILLKENGTLFKFLDPVNRKVKATFPETLHYRGFFEWARKAFEGTIAEARKNILPALQGVWNPIQEKLLSEAESSANPDEILNQMKKALEQESFSSAVRKKYAAVIIDEFQDTDAVQWEIFRRLFLEKSLLRALYFVGDPKQSIYRFRKADVYVYLQARDLLGDRHLFHLDTNFRSSKSLVGALNALFDRDWLHLPKAGRSLPYLPVQAGSSTHSVFSDQKGAVHFLLSEGDRKESFEREFIPFAAAEIERLLPELKTASSFAILVKDRFQGEKALNFLQKRGIPAVARSRTSLGDTFAFDAIRELFAAISKPTDLNAAKIVLAGPFGGEDLQLPFDDWKQIVEEKGLVRFCNAFFNHCVQGSSLLKKIVSYDAGFYRDLLQLFELLFDWERKEGFSFLGLQAFFRCLEESRDDQEGFQRRMEVDESAVQIMTLHASKGLEFEIVFALGLSSLSPETEEEAEEINAEKLRQLYVAMTRAKRRLYVPAVLSEKEAPLSAQSPMELFCKHLESSLPDFLLSLSQKESVTFERWVQSSPSPQNLEKEMVPLTFVPKKISYDTSIVHSFTSLAQTKHESSPEFSPSLEFTLHTLPRGAETGIVIHSLFEKIFSLPDRKNDAAIDLLVEEELRFTSLVLWKDCIQKMVKQTLSMQLMTRDGLFSLADLKGEEMQVEMEFLFHSPPHFVKGFIDLVFCYKEKFYFLDWKTNWLGENEEAYHFAFLDAAMKAHDYPLQAALYAEALRRHLGIDDFTEKFGGAFYLFVRGAAAYYLMPDLNLIREFHGTS